MKEQQDDHGQGKSDYVEVVVITTSGTYPKKGTDRVPADEKVREELERAAKHLHIVDTNGWIARVDGREIDQEKSYTQNHLTGTVKIDYHKREGGGGQ